MAGRVPCTPRAGKVDWQVHLYGGVVHSYTDPTTDARGQPAAFRYDAGADAHSHSWAAMQALFAGAFA